VRESADLLYNLVVLWASSGITPDEVWKEMNRRERLFGIAEKMLKSRDAKVKVRPPLPALNMRRAQKRR
jgi:phosphoribosyl-ATP pyrophosphohydrolase